MAFTKSPQTWLGAGYTVSSSKVQMNTASAGSNVVLTKLTDAQADPSTGDIRDVARAFCFALQEAWDDQTAGNRPTKMKLEKSTVAQGNTVLQETYQFTFYTTSDPQEVVDEP